MVDFRRALGDENLKSCDELDKYWSILDSNGKFNPSELGHKTPVHSYPWDMCFWRIIQIGFRRSHHPYRLCPPGLRSPWLNDSSWSSNWRRHRNLGRSANLPVAKILGLCRDQICSTKCRFMTAMVKTQCITGHCHIYIIYDHIYIYIPYWKIKHNACTNPNNGLKAIPFYGNRNQV